MCMIEMFHNIKGDDAFDKIEIMSNHFESLNSIYYEFKKIGFTNISDIVISEKDNKLLLTCIIKQTIDIDNLKGDIDISIECIDDDINKLNIMLK